MQSACRILDVIASPLHAKRGYGTLIDFIFSSTRTMHLHTINKKLDISTQQPGYLCNPTRLFFAKLSGLSKLLLFLFSHRLGQIQLADFLLMPQMEARQTDEAG